LNVEERSFNRWDISVSVPVAGDWSLSLHLSPESCTLSAAGLSDLPVELVTLFVVQVSLDCALVDLVESLVFLAVLDALLVDAQGSKDHGGECEGTKED